MISKKWVFKLASRRDQIDGHEKIEFGANLEDQRIGDRIKPESVIGMGQNMQHHPKTTPQGTNHAHNYI